ncbi:jg9769, partial [Pararge aegeria aegeria]
MCGTGGRQVLSAAMANEEGVPVDLYIYDLTNGLAALLSPSIL